MFKGRGLKCTSLHFLSHFKTKKLSRVTCLQQPTTVYRNDLGNKRRRGLGRSQSVGQQCRLSARTGTAVCLWRMANCSLGFFFPLLRHDVSLIIRYLNVLFDIICRSAVFTIALINCHFCKRNKTYRIRKRISFQFHDTLG